jgi:hypothetical protein
LESSKGESATYVDLGIIRQASQCLVQSLVHLSGITLEESAASWVRLDTVFTVARLGASHQRTTNEECISSEDHALLPILHEIADAVLRVTRGVQSADGDSVANLEFLTMYWRLRDRFAVVSSNDGDIPELCQLGYISLEPYLRNRQP